MQPHAVAHVSPADLQGTALLIAVRDATDLMRYGKTRAEVLRGLRFLDGPAPPGACGPLIVPPAAAAAVAQELAARRRQSVEAALRWVAFSGALPCVLSLVATSGDAELRAAAWELLWRLLSAQTVAAEEVAGAALPAWLVALLRSPEIATRALGLRLTGVVAAGGGWPCQALLRAGVLRAAAERTGAADATHDEQCLLREIARGLLRGEGAAAEDALRDALPVLGAPLAARDDTTLVHALRFLVALMWKGSAGRVAAVLDSGVVPAVVALLRAGSFGVHCEAVDALVSVAAGASAEQLRRLYSGAAVVETIIWTAGARRRGITLRRVLEPRGTCVAEEGWLAVFTGLVLPALHRALADAATENRVGACTLIDALHSTALTQVMDAAGVYAAVVECARTCGGSQAVLEAATAALHSASRGSKGAAASALRRLQPLLAAGADADAAAVTWALQTARTLLRTCSYGRDATARSAALEAGTLADALRLAGHADPRAAAAALDVVALLCEEHGGGDELRGRVLAAAAPVIARHAGSPSAEVSTAALKALQAALEDGGPLLAPALVGADTVAAACAAAGGPSAGDESLSAVLCGLFSDAGGATAVMRAARVLLEAVRGGDGEQVRRGAVRALGLVAAGSADRRAALFEYGALDALAERVAAGDTEDAPGALRVLCRGEPPEPLPEASSAVLAALAGAAVRAEAHGDAAACGRCLDALAAVATVASVRERCAQAVARALPLLRSTSADVVAATLAALAAAVKMGRWPAGGLAHLCHAAGGDAFFYTSLRRTVSGLGAAAEAMCLARQLTEALADESPRVRCGAARVAVMWAAGSSADGASNANARLRGALREAGAVAALAAAAATPDADEEGVTAAAAAAEAVDMLAS